MQSILEIGLKTQDLRTGHASTVRILDDIKRKSRETTGSIDKIEGSFSRLKSMIFSVKGLMVGLASSWVARDFIRAASDMENYNVRLKILLGDTQKASDLFQSMSKYASQVPFEYRDVMGSATTLAGVVKGGVEEVNQWIPLIGDLAAASGMGIQETTGQVIRMLSAGASAADMFRERGILAMLGFKSGVKYSVEETKKMLQDAWEDPQSRFKGATEELKTSWSGLTSMLSDAWMQFQMLVMNSGIFDWLKAGVKSVTEELKHLNESMNQPKKSWLQDYLDALKSSPMTADSWFTKQIDQYINPKKPREIYSSNAIQVRQGGLPGATPTNKISPDDLQMRDELREIAKEATRADDAIKELLNEQLWDKFSKEIEPPKSQWSEFNDVLEKTGSEFKNAGLEIRISTYKDEAKSAMEEVTEVHQTFFDRFSDQITSYKDQFTEAFIDLPSKGMESFKDMFDSILKDVLRFQIKKSITEPLSGGLNSWLTGITGRASGGPVYGGNSYIVGEAGPELFSPGASGAITPNNALGGMNVNIQVVGSAIPSNASVRVEQQQSGVNKIFKIVIDKVAEDIADGGTVARALDTRYGLAQRGY